MEGLIRLINYSVNSSVKGFIRWAEILTYPRGTQGLEYALAPAQRVPTISQLQQSEEEEDPTKWSGFLWAVPKKRTTIMKRIRRKFGHQDWGSPLLKPKTNLRICDTCGHHYEAFHLCGNCYQRIKEETEMIREKAAAEFGHNAEDKNIVVMYESDRTGAKSVDTKWAESNNIIVEISKPRPNWFCGNLMQKSTLRSNPDAKAIVPQLSTPIVKKS